MTPKNGQAEINLPLIKNGRGSGEGQMMVRWSGERKGMPGEHQVKFR